MTISNQPPHSVVDKSIPLADTEKISQKNQKRLNVSYQIYSGVVGIAVCEYLASCMRKKSIAELSLSWQQQQPLFSMDHLCRQLDISTLHQPLLQMIWRALEKALSFFFADS